MFLYSLLLLFLRIVTLNWKLQKVVSHSRMNCMQRYRISSSINRFGHV